MANFPIEFYVKMCLEVTGYVTPLNHLGEPLESKQDKKFAWTFSHSCYQPILQLKYLWDAMSFDSLHLKMYCAVSGEGFVYICIACS